MRSTSPLSAKPVRGINREERGERGKDAKWDSLRLFAFCVLSFPVWLGVDRIGACPVISPSEGRKIVRIPPTRPRFGELHASERRIPLPSPILSFRRLLFFSRLR